MKHFLRNAVLATALLASTSAPALAEAAKRPNFLVIVADDLGFSDIGAFGGEIATPNLDKLALQGVRLTDFHTAPTCSPTRSMLLTGSDSHVAGLGSMAEGMAANQRGKPGHEGYLRSDVATVAERLSTGGYRTLFSGKWHLGLKPDQDPHARGFRQSFALLHGGHNHFGLGLSVDPAKGYTYSQDGQVISSLPATFYSSDYFADRLIDQLQTAKQPSESSKPFFALLTFTAPHWPLQAPAADIARYRGRYDEGFDVLRARRLKRQEELGLVAPGTLAHSVKAPAGGWDALTAEQKRNASRDMEIYAAMVDRLDQNVGRVIETLRKTGELDNTIVLFLADNGAEGLDGETTGKQLLGARIAEADNSLDNRGAASSYVTYGPGWAQAATAPRWLIKGYATEGGTRTVSFINAPGAARQGQVAGAFTHVTDVVPTILDFAGVSPRAKSATGEALKPITGHSWRPYLEAKAPTVYAADESLGTELFGSRSLRQGDWKITDIGDGTWRLFDLARDPGETQDLSSQDPQRLKALSERWQAYAQRVGVIIPDGASYRP
ncbi:MAG: arylsulfatase [Novosphingobium sp.]|nr:MAG: arylsulfatase [Novosphingobium sp.]